MKYIEELIALNEHKLHILKAMRSNPTEWLKNSFMQLVVDEEKLLLEAMNKTVSPYESASPYKSLVESLKPATV